ncbi:hypothetical protein QBC47DRAFT_394630, partial [Echria macrotheca]
MAAPSGRVYVQQSQHTEPSRVVITEAQLDTIRRCSPIIELHWLRLHSYPQYIWTIPCDNIDHGAIRTMLTRVSDPDTDQIWLDSREIRAGDMGRYCDALWHLRIVPELLPSCNVWRNHHRVKDPNPPPDPPPQPAEAEADTLSWHRQLPPGWDLNACLQTARAALVLGNERKFATEMKLALLMLPGNFPEVADTGADTPVKRLRVSRLKDIRHRELAGIQDVAKEFLEHRGQTSMLNRLPDDQFSERESIRGYLEKFERNLAGLESESSSSSPSPATNGNISDLRYGARSMAGHKVRRRLNLFGRALGGPPKEDETTRLIHDLLVAVDDHISEQLDEIVEELKAWRNQKVSGWMSAIYVNIDN